ncbi:unnamed protein product [Anisakis simplex]|uniref:MATH domain-containing protein n=1 Tax=Anisakis simplex TaxID=6269 RepID=A0A0M3JWV7_ANISI|nr:unnamed protein product [Anisakis simplex]
MKELMEKIKTDVAVREEQVRAKRALLDAAFKELASVQPHPLNNDFVANVLGVRVKEMNVAEEVKLTCESERLVVSACQSGVLLDGCLELVVECKLIDDPPTYTNAERLYQCLCVTCFSEHIEMTPNEIIAMLNRLSAFTNVDFGDWSLITGNLNTQWQGVTIFCSSNTISSIPSGCHIFVRRACDLMRVKRSLYS